MFNRVFTSLPLILVALAGCDGTDKTANESPVPQQTTTALNHYEAVARSTLDLEAQSKLVLPSHWNYALSELARSELSITAPFDNQLALAKVALGASNQTAQAILETAKLADDSYSHTEFSQWEQALEPLFTVSNAGFYGQSHYLFANDYLDEMASLYGPEFQSLDFTAEDGSAAQLIESDLSSAFTSLRFPEKTRVALSQTSQGQATWSSSLTQVQAYQGYFLEGDDSTNRLPIVADMVKLTGHLLQFSGDNYQAVDIPLAGDELALLVVTPASGQFLSVMTQMAEASFWQTLLQQRSLEILHPEHTVYLPLFEFESMLTPNSATLADALSESYADFSQVNEQGYLYLDAPILKAKLALSQEGIAYQSATLTTLLATQEEPDSVWVGLVTSELSFSSLFIGCTVSPDQSAFIYTLYHTGTGTILYLGQVLALPGEHDQAPTWMVDAGEECGEPPVVE